MSVSSTRPATALRRSATRHRVVALGAAVVALAAATAVAPGAAVAAAAPAAGRYVPLSPTRVLDSDTSGGSFRPGETRTVDLSKAFTQSASAVVLNLTAAGGTAGSFQTVFPTGVSRPTASSLNEGAGTVRANSVTVAVGQGGSSQNKVDVYNSQGTVRIVVDVLGYYTNASAGVVGTAYAPLASPVRLFDSRTTPGPLTRSMPVGNATVDYGTPAVNKLIDAVLVNITATETSGSGYLSVWNGTGSPPATSTLNFAGNQTVANMAIVPVRCSDTSCETLAFSIYSGVASSVQIIGDLQGAYVEPGQADTYLFKPLAAPQRVVDTRTSTPFPTLGQDGVGSVSAASFGSGAAAVNLNVTAVQPTASAFLTVWAAGVGRPFTSSVNASPGDIVANAAQTKLGANNSGFQVYNNAGRTDVVVDVAGVFVPDPAAG